MGDFFCLFEIKREEGRRNRNAEERRDRGLKRGQRREKRGNMDARGKKEGNK